MVALLRDASAAALGMTLIGLASAAAQEDAGASPHRWLVQANVGYAAVDSSNVGWLSGGLGKLRHDETDRRPSLDRLLVDFRAALAPTLFAQLDVDYLRDGSSGFDVTEAYLEWRPVPRSPSRHRIRLGGFYPRLSLENTEPGWETPYSISSSAINTWIAEEVKPLGLEWSLQRRLGGAGAPHEIELFAAAFYGNDPAGTLLAWKGWGIHDRQTRWREQLPLPPLPQLRPGTRLRRNQAPHAEPFIEIDHAPGYYVGAEWRYARRVSLQAAHYDNRADPTAVADGQYGWDTRFDHLALRLSLPWDLGLLAQWMQGDTAMGSVIESFGTRVVYNEFESGYVLLTRYGDGHRLTARYDRFSVRDEDLLPLDDNEESGRALMLAYAYDLSPGLELVGEWLRVESRRPARAYLGLDEEATETELRLQLRWRLSARPE